MGAPVKHGLYARSPSALAIRGRKVARLMRRLRDVAPWLEPSDESTARAYCELEILSAAIFARLSQTGPTRVTTDGKDLEVRRLVDAHRQMKQAQLAYARELGLTPLARAALKVAGSKAAFDLPSAMSAADEAETVSPEDASEESAANAKEGETTETGD
jgi:phage terminase small subunit